MITAIQIKLIHIAKHQLNIEDDIYVDILQERYNVSSSTKLSKNEADNLLGFFKEKGFKSRKKKLSITKNGKIITLVKTPQLTLIEILKANIVWRNENGYQLWLQKRMKIKKIITMNDAQKVIEGLKGMIGIDSKIIINRELPFSYNTDQVIASNTGKGLMWYYDFTNQKLVAYSNSEQGVLRCLTK